MAKSIDVFVKKLANRLAGYGEVSSFSKKSGISRPTLDKWLNGQSCPSLDFLDQVSKSMDLEPWEMIRPDGTEDKPKNEALEKLIADIRKLEKDELAIRVVKSVVSPFVEKLKK